MPSTKLLQTLLALADGAAVSSRDPFAGHSRHLQQGQLCEAEVNDVVSCTVDTGRICDTIGIEDRCPAVIDTADPFSSNATISNVTVSPLNYSTETYTYASFCDISMSYSCWSDCCLFSSSCQETAQIMVDCFAREYGCVSSFSCDGSGDSLANNETQIGVEVPDCTDDNYVGPGDPTPNDDWFLPAQTPEEPPPEEASGSGGVGCFSAEATVQVRNKGTVPIKDVQINDMILTATKPKQGRQQRQHIYEPVYAFGHKSHDTVGNFYQITTTSAMGRNTDSGPSLEMTGEHLVFVKDQPNPVRADSIKVGDILIGHNRNEDEDSNDTTSRVVTSIAVVQKTGLYDILTPSGMLVVDGIAVSSYVALLQEGTDPEYRWQFPRVSHHTLAHLYLTPFRMVCQGVSSSLCERYTKEGMPCYVDYGVKLVQWTGLQTAIVRGLFWSVTGAIVLGLWLVELVFGAEMGPLVLIVLVPVLARRGFIMAKRKNSASGNLK